MASRGLGKGLSALISENYVQPAAAATNKAAQQKAEKPEAPAGGISSIPVGKLIGGKYQPRTQFSEEALSELAESIEKNGLMQPIIVRRSDTQAGKYEIIAGERRWRASKIAGLPEIAAIVRELTDQQALELALVENIQRQDLSVLEEANGYQRLIDEFRYTQEALANTIGKSRSHIANMLRLLSLPERVKGYLDQGKISAGHARALLNAPDPIALAEMIIDQGLNVRQAEDRTREAKGKKKRPTPRMARSSGDMGEARDKDPDIISLEESLSDNLGLKVSINDRGQSGEILLYYDSLKQLDEILQRLGKRI